MHDDEQTDHRPIRWLAMVVGLLLSAGAAGAAVVAAEPSQETQVSANGATVTTASDTTVPEPRTASTAPPGAAVLPTIPPPSPTAPVAPPTTAATVPRMQPTTTTVKPVTTTTTAPPPPPDTGRPLCSGEAWGYNGYGCSVTRTEGRITTVWSAYGQVAQANRDGVQVELRVTDAEGGLPRSWRIDYGDGTVSEDGGRYTCQRPLPPITDNEWHTYKAPGTYDITVTVTTSRCAPHDPNAPTTETLYDDQTMSVAVPVRVCTQVQASNTAVYCTVP